MADPHTPGHIMDAHIAAGKSIQPQIEKMAEHIRLLSEEVIRLSGQLTIHPQHHHDMKEARQEIK
jgi:hypothetical protein